MVATLREHQGGTDPLAPFGVIHADDRAEASASNHVMRTEKRTIRYVARLSDADGGYTGLRIVVKPILNERGNIVRTEGAAIPECE